MSQTTKLKCPECSEITLPRMVMKQGIGDRVHCNVCGALLYRLSVNVWPRWIVIGVLAYGYIALVPSLLNLEFGAVAIWVLVIVLGHIAKGFWEGHVQRFFDKQDDLRRAMIEAAKE